MRGGAGHPRVALVTAEVAREVDDDLPPLIAALEALGVEVEAPAWDDPGVDWSGYDVAVVRSTWDYTARHGEFLAWADDVGARTRLLNPPAVLRWNSDKRYLGDLAAAGIPVVPTTFLPEPADLPDPGEVDQVVKPTVSAGSKDTARFRPSQRGAARELAERIWAGGRAVMVQPYLSSVDRDGETALIHVDGGLSHAIRKGPLLRPDEPPTRALFAAEHISPTSASAEHRELARATLAAIAGIPAVTEAAGGATPLAYARVDVVRDEDGRLAVLEVELCEPSLFLATDPSAADRFARVIAVRAGGVGPS